MAIINCSECGKEISDKAAACPNCGAPAEKIRLIPCPNCQKEVLPGASICPHCKRVLKTSTNRRCLSCGYIGQMKTWLRNYSLPQFIALVLAFFYIIPAIIFIAWGWGKHKCPQCGALGKNIPSAPPIPDSFKD